MNYELRGSKARSTKAIVIAVIKYVHTVLFLHPDPSAYPFYAHSLFYLSKLAGRRVASLVTIWKDLAP